MAHQATKLVLGDDQPTVRLLVRTDLRFNGFCFANNLFCFNKTLFCSLVAFCLPFTGIKYYCPYPRLKFWPVNVPSCILLLSTLLSLADGMHPQRESRFPSDYWGWVCHPLGLSYFLLSLLSVLHIPFWANFGPTVVIPVSTIRWIRYDGSCIDTAQGMVNNAHIS